MSLYHTNTMATIYNLMVHPTVIKNIFDHLPSLLDRKHFCRFFMVFIHFSVLRNLNYFLQEQVLECVAAI